MEVRKGYKQTEAGVIPYNWAIKKLGEISTISSGGTPSRQMSSYWGGDIPWITTTQIDFNVIKEANEFITKEGMENSAAKICKSGALLMAMYGQGKTRGKIAKLGIDATINQACAAIKLNGVLFSDYIFLNLSSRYEEIRSLSNIGNQENLNSQIISNIFIPIPPLPEQHAIAAALNDVNALLNSLDALIAKKRLIKQGAMQELLTGKKRLPGFDGEWEEKKLGELAVLSKAGINPASSPETLFAHFSLPAFDAGAVPIIEKGSQIGSNKFLVPDNAVLISKLNPRIPRIWAPTSVPENAICSTEFLVLTPREDINRNFLAVLCSSPAVSSQMDLHAIGTTGSHQRIHPSQVLAIEVNVPKDKEEQTAIAEILSDMDAEISALEQKREKTRLLKQGMMQELLTGRIRLI